MAKLNKHGGCQRDNSEKGRPHLAMVELELRIVTLYKWLAIPCFLAKWERVLITCIVNWEDKQIFKLRQIWTTKTQILLVKFTIP
jgi:hypothetical protein